MIFRALFIVFSAGVVLAVPGSLFLMKTYHLTFLEMVNKSAEKLGVVENGQRLIEYEKKYTVPITTLKQNESFPKFLPADNNSNFSYYEYLTFNIKALQKNKGYSPNCSSNDIRNLFYCHILGERDIDELLRELTLYKFIPPREVGFYGNALEFIVVLDLLRGSGINIPRTEKALIDEKLKQMLESYLFVLDGDSASLFHGRSVLASNAWLLATHLDSDEIENQESLNRAFGHFYDFFEALEAVEIWPEGYNYWANSRGFQITLAISALKSLEPNSLLLDVRAEALLERIGLWHIYNTRPDWTIAGWADEGPRVDLKDETSRIIDLIALATSNTAIHEYARLLRQRFGGFNYYRAYKWYLPALLSNEAAKEVVKKKSNVTLASLEHLLEPVAIFGEDFSNHIVIRSGWEADDTLIQIRASDRFTHHQHFDAGSFTVFANGEPLIVNASRYKNVFTENRKYFSGRSISKNTVFINSKNESFQPSSHYKINSKDGGQRIPLATHSSITSFDNWKSELSDGYLLEMAEVKEYKEMANGDVNIWLDITKAYNSIYGVNGHSTAKARRVVRQLYYLNKERMLLVYDNINTTSSSLDTGIRLHFAGKPIIAAHKGKQTVGTDYDGIFEFEENNLIEVDTDQRSSIAVYSPTKFVTRLIGGQEYRTYVEVDGDYKEYNGFSFPDGYEDERWFDKSDWRLDFSAFSAKSIEFLTIIQLDTDFDFKVEENTASDIVIFANGKKVASAVFSPKSKSENGVRRIYE